MLLMRSHVTAEGEDFMKYHELEVHSPNTVAGTSSVVHVIEDDSPLRGMTEEYLKRLTAADFQLVVTMTGLDSNFQAEISAMKKYRPKQVVFDQLFQSVMKLDANNKAYVDFTALSQTVAIDPDALAAGAAKRAEEEKVTGEPVVAGDDGTVHVCFGCWHTAPAEPLKPVCVFCQRVRWVLEETDTPFTAHRIDLSDKPEWFTKLNKCGLTPFANVGGRWISESEDILDALEGAYPAVRALLARPCALPNDLADGSALARQFQAMVDTEPGSEDAEDALDDWVEVLAKINSHLIFNGPFLCGPEPGRVDFTLGCLLWTQVLKARVWYDFDPDDTPAVDIYLGRLEKRDAWSKGSIDKYMHLMWSIDVLRSKPAEMQKLSKAAIDDLLERSDKESPQNKTTKINMCL